MRSLHRSRPVTATATAVGPARRHRAILWSLRHETGRIGPGAGQSRTDRSSPPADKEKRHMSLFQRAHDIIEARANKALDAAEKPDEMLDLSYEKMLEQLTQVRRSLLDIAASKKQIELQETQLQHSVDHLQDQAKQALTAGREDLAREALSRKAAAQAQIDGME